MDRTWRTGSDDSAHGPGSVTAPGKRTLTGTLHRAASPGAATPASPGDAFAAATSGAPSLLPHQSYLEEIFGASFAGVEAHVGTPEALAGLHDLGARAAAFGDTVAFADAAPDLHLTAHEVAHVVQHRNGGGGVQAKAERVSDPGDAAEVAADRAADAAVRGERVTDVGRADGVALHRAPQVTNGGTFTDVSFVATNSGAAIGAQPGPGAGMDLHFAANDLVETPADGIALIQTVRTRSNLPIGGGPLHSTNDVVWTGEAGFMGHPDPDQRAIVATSGAGAGRAVDEPIHMPNPLPPGSPPGTPRTDRPGANHNPIYGVGFGAPDTSTSLAGGTPTVTHAQRGGHVRLPSGAMATPIDAIVADGPAFSRAMVGHTAEFEAEVAAIVTKPGTTPTSTPDHTYLGSVSWGWSYNGNGIVTLRPLTTLSLGAPTASFMGAATTWNAATLHPNSTGTGPATIGTIDVPIATPTAGAATAPGAANTAPLPSTLGTRALIAQLGTMAASLPASGEDRTNQIFQMRAVAAELRTREVRVRAINRRLQDTGSAARPPEDEIFVELTTPGHFVRTETHVMRRGADHTFHARLALLMEDDHPTTPPSFPAAIQIQTFDHDRVGRGPGTDDTIDGFSWAAPFVREIAVTSQGYDLDIDFGP